MRGARFVGSYFGNRRKWRRQGIAGEGIKGGHPGNRRIYYGEFYVCLNWAAGEMLHGRISAAALLTINFHIYVQVYVKRRVYVQITIIYKGN